MAGSQGARHRPQNHQAKLIPYQILATTTLFPFAMENRWALAVGAKETATIFINGNFI